MLLAAFLQPLDLAAKLGPLTLRLVELKLLLFGPACEVVETALELEDAETPGGQLVYQLASEGSRVEAGIRPAGPRPRGRVKETGGCQVAKLHVAAASDLRGGQAAALDSASERLGGQAGQPRGLCQRETLVLLHERGA